MRIFVEGVSAEQKREILKRVDGERLLDAWRIACEYFDPFDTEEYELVRAEVLKRLENNIEQK